MKNKGFTLIELLSVIVVLAIIALIAIPMINGVITKAKLGALKDSAYGLIDASNLYAAMNEVTENVRFDKNDSEDTLKDLKYKGQVKEGTVIINKKGQITVCITDGKNSAYKNYVESTVTLVAKKTCNVPSNSNIVFLDNERTVDELSNVELTAELAKLKEEINSLKSNKADKTELTSVDDIYPVGSIYMSTTDNTVAKVEARFGGTWEVYGDGRMIKSSTEAAGTTGGSNSVTLAANQIPSLSVSGTAASAGAHTHSVSGTAASAGTHSHSIGPNTTNGLAVATGSGADDINWSFTDVNTTSHQKMYALAAGAHTHSVSGTAASAGAHTHTVTASYTNSNQQKVNVENKYITVYMYKRTA